MVRIVIHILLGFLSVIGLATVIQGIVRRVTDIPDESRRLLVLLCDEDADLKLMSAVELVRRCPSISPGGIFALDVGLSETNAYACRRIAENAGFVTVLTVGEGQQWLGGFAGERDVPDPRNGGEDHVL